MTLAADYPELFSALRQVVPASIKLYLVGGAVRDLLLGKPINDFDFAAEGLVRPIGKKLADLIGGRYYVMDDQRDIVRVIVKPRKGSDYNIDIAQISGASIEDDLRERDFTINAVAIEVVNEDRMVDPLNGAGDLRQRRLKMCSADSLQNDPMRAIRAIRMTLDYDLRMDDELINALHEIPPLLRESSIERYRDEILKTIKTNRNDAAFRLFRHFHLLDHYFPGFCEDQCDLTQAILRHLDQFSELLTPNPDENKTSDIRKAEAAFRFAPYRPELRDYLNRDIVLHRNRESLMKMVAYCKNLSKNGSDALNWLKRLPFGTDEINYMRRVIEASSVSDFAAPALPTDVAIYRYFRAYGDAGIAGWLLSLAEQYAADEYLTDTEALNKTLDRGSALLDAWFRRYDTCVAPDPLLTGDEIIQLLGTHPGPLVGQIKTALLEAQVAETVTTKEAAVTFCQSFRG